MRAVSAVLALAATGCAATPPPVTTRPASVPIAVAKPPAASQYLYGSAEAAALSQQAWNGLVTYVADAVAGARAGRPLQHVLATPDKPGCDGRPPAVVVDMDETLILNLGHEYHAARRGLAFDPARWERWEASGAAQVIATPGAREALARLRAMGVAVIINTNRNASTAAASIRALDLAGLGQFEHRRTAFFKGDVDGKSAKDGRRTAIAQSWCVVAMAGDQLGDFSDQFNAPATSAPERRALPGEQPYAARWGNGWFVLPNPVYGTGLGSDWDTTFPPDKRWTDPTEGAK